MDHLNHLLADATFNLTGPGVAPGDKTQATLNLEKIISQVIGVLTIVAFVWFAVQIILAGYAFLTSEGEKNKMEIARKRLTEGLIGMIIIVVAVGLSALVGTIFGLGSIFNINQMLTNLGL